MSPRKHSDVLTTSEFARELDRAIRTHNATRHRGIDREPLSAWRNAGKEITRAEERDVALALLRREPVNIDLHGRVPVNGVEYIGKASIAHRGEPLEAGWLATRPEFIELFDPTERRLGGYLGRCTPLDETSGKLAGLVERVRDREIATVRDADSRASQLRQELALTRDSADRPAADQTANRRRSRRTSKPATSANDRRRRLADAGIFRPGAEE